MQDSTVYGGANSLSTPNTEPSALDYLDAAESAYISGDDQEASRLMWKATQVTFAALAQTRGLDGGDLIELAKVLESDGLVPKYHYRGGLVGATLLRDHADMEVLESHELKDAYEATREFVRDCFDDKR